MTHERRRFHRIGVNWRGHATLTTGPRLAVRVLDFSEGGARLALPVGCLPHAEQTLELTAIRRGFWPFRPSEPVSAVGRVVRSQESEGQDYIEVGVRFHIPLRKRTRRVPLPALARQWLTGSVATCA